VPSGRLGYDVVFSSTVNFFRMAHSLLDGITLLGLGVRARFQVCRPGQKPEINRRAPLIAALGCCYSLLIHYILYFTYIAYSVSYIISCHRVNPPSKFRRTRCLPRNPDHSLRDSYQQAQPSWFAGVELIFTSITVPNSQYKGLRIA
jgi:hypothetical protein